MNLPLFYQLRTWSVLQDSIGPLAFVRLGQSHVQATHSHKCSWCGVLVALAQDRFFAYLL